MSNNTPSAKHRKASTLPVAAIGPPPEMAPASLTLEIVPLSSLRPHPRNYRAHPDDEIEHLMESIRANGIYRNIVTAAEGTILAGRGVAQAAARLGIEHVPIYRTPYAPDDPRALKLLVADNEISHLAANDDRALTELLRELNATDGLNGLLGTGYDEQMLANLVMVTRPTAEIGDLAAAEQWVGMPEYDMEGKDGRLEIIVRFVDEADRVKFCRRLDLDARVIPTTGGGRAIWWPNRQVRDDYQSVRFTDREHARTGIGPAGRHDADEEGEGDDDA